MICLYQQEGLDYSNLIHSTLKRYLNLSVTVKEKIKIPTSAFNAIRLQYEAEKIIDSLSKKTDAECPLKIMLTSMHQE